MKENNSAEIVAQSMELYRRGNEYVAQNKADEARLCFHEALDKGYVNYGAGNDVRRWQKPAGNGDGGKSQRE